MSAVMKSVRLMMAATMALTLICAAAAQESVWDRRKDVLDQAQRHYQQGKRCIEEGNFTAANEEFNKVELLLQEARTVDLPAAAHGPLVAGETTAAPADTERVEKALSYYLTELKKETSNPDYYYNLGIEYLTGGKFAQAEEAFKLVVNLDPLDKDACYNLGVLYENYLGSPEKALRYYQQYLNIAPDACDAETVRGWIASLTEGSRQ